MTGINIWEPDGKIQFYTAKEVLQAEHGVIWFVDTQNLQHCYYNMPYAWHQLKDEKYGER